MLLIATLKLALPVTFSLLLPLSGLLPRRLLVGSLNSQMDRAISIRHSDISKGVGVAMSQKSGTDIHTAQELMGYNDVSATRIYTHAIAEHYAGTQSPLDNLNRPDGLGLARKIIWKVRIICLSLADYPLWFTVITIKL